MWIVVTLLIAFFLGLAVLYLFRNNRKRNLLANSNKLGLPKERAARQKHWEDRGNTPEARQKRTIEEIKQEILRAQEIED
jgi:hypothetical protein